MVLDEYYNKRFNKVDTLTAVFTSKHHWCGDDYPELEIGKEYKVTYIGVGKSSSDIMLEGFDVKPFNTVCFELFENGESCDRVYVNDPRFWAPYYRERRRKRQPSYYNDQIVKYCIPKHIENIEKEFDVKVLLAVESGSRAWGFESENSDWDVRFIYVHRPEWYLKVEEQRDVIEYIYDDDVDMVGWELRKSLRLLRRSNPSLFEWLHSPKVYFVDKSFEEKVRMVEFEYFNPTKAMYHYNRIYNKHNERYLQQEGYPAKRFLYYLRGILACKWIEKNKNILLQS